MKRRIKLTKKQLELLRSIIRQGVSNNPHHQHEAHQQQEQEKRQSKNRRLKANLRHWIPIGLSLFLACPEKAKNQIVGSLIGLAKGFVWIFWSG